MRKGRSGGDKTKVVDGSPLQGPVGHGEEAGLYPKINGKFKRWLSCCRERTAEEQGKKQGCW